MKAELFLRRYSAIFYIAGSVFVPVLCRPQMIPDSSSVSFTLDQCVGYALKNHPQVRQSVIDEEINRKDIGISLSGWLPQVDLDASLNHYIQLPVSFFPDPNNPAGQKIEVTTGLINTSSALFSATQSLYSTDLVFAGKMVHNLRLRAHQSTQNTEISTIVNVSRSFYDVMLTIEQVDLWKEDIQRLQRSYEDAYHLYQSGLADKIDSQQALISLNNARIQKKEAEESVKTKYAILKQSMGYPPEKELVISYDSASMENQIGADTSRQLDYSKRIEYRQVQTNILLQHAEVGYFRWSFLPGISAYYNYNLNFANNEFSPLYNGSFPNSLIGLKLTLPLFQGNSRILNLRKAQLMEKRLDTGEEYLRNQISTEYTQALGNYKSNLYSLELTKNNVDIARKVFNTVSLQYSQGIKTYLDLIVAETDLRGARLNYLSALFQVLSSKLDLSAAMGDIVVN
jgi:outer membrane protein